MYEVLCIRYYSVTICSETPLSITKGTSYQYLTSHQKCHKSHHKVSLLFHSVLRVADMLFLIKKLCVVLVVSLPNNQSTKIKTMVTMVYISKYHSITTFFIGLVIVTH